MRVKPRIRVITMYGRRVLAVFGRGPRPVAFATIDGPLGWSEVIRTRLPTFKVFKRHAH